MNVTLTWARVEHAGRVSSDVQIITETLNWLEGFGLAQELFVGARA